MWEVLVNFAFNGFVKFRTYYELWHSGLEREPPLSIFKTPIVNTRLVALPSRFAGFVYRLFKLDTCCAV
eukprot:5756045-Amphidinium_carterae.1